MKLLSVVINGVRILRVASPLTIGGFSPDFWLDYFDFVKYYSKFFALRC